MIRFSLPFLFAVISATPAWSQPMLNIVHPLPPQSPSWLPGYQVRWPVRILGEPNQQAAKTVVISLPTGGWLKPDASDLVVQTGGGKVFPVTVLSHDPAGETIIQFKRNDNDPWYWVYGVNAKAPPAKKLDATTDPVLREGLTLELGDWAGEDLSSWLKVRSGLEKSPTIIGNAIVTNVIQNCNPARPDQANKFAASYRGFLDIKKEGVYRFFVNAEDAAFLFIDGFKVFERPGSNAPLGTVKLKDLERIAGKVELKPGVHAFEVHHVVGDQPQARGTCALSWTTPDQPKFSFVPATAIAHPLYARVAATEREDGAPAGAFSCGIDDTLEAGGLKLFLVRFEADGNIKDASKLRWELGDGTTAVGQSIRHIYFKEGDYHITLNAGAGLPAFRQRLRVWPEPGDTSPLSLEVAVNLLGKMEWKSFDLARIREIFTFLQMCEQPNRWPLLDAVAQHLLERKELDLESRSQLLTARMEALTQQGRAAAALKLGEGSLAEFAKTPVLQVRLQLSLAAIHQYHYKDAASASKIYKNILDEHKRVEHPNLRLAGVRWGDLFAEAGDLARASETYRIAATLGGDKLVGGTVTEAATRGALMRIAEQKLKGGEIQATRQLLERMELEFPGRRLDGLYCFMRAETDRHAGRYEDALRSYEMIFKLPQWAGYRDRATLGIADTYHRMGELEKALKWYGNLGEAFPKFYADQKGPDLTRMIGDRLERIKTATAAGNRDAAFFAGYSTGFEPEEKEWFGHTAGYAMVTSPGIRGPHVLLLDVYPREYAGPDHVVPLKNLMPGGTYWIEIWYCDLFRPFAPPVIGSAYVHARLLAEPPSKEVTIAAHMEQYRTSHHRWHKLSTKIKAPLAQDAKLSLSFNNQTGAFIYDALSIQPVTDRQLDSLTTFLDGGKAP